PTGAPLLTRDAKDAKQSAVVVVRVGAREGPGPANVSRVSVKAPNLPPTLPVATGYQAVDIFPNLSFVQPLSVVAPPGKKDRLFVVSKTGTIEVVTNLDGKNGPPTKSVFLDLNPYLQQKGMQLGQSIEWGLMGLA